nr:hypothetical protein [Oenococcus oeni]
MSERTLSMRTTSTSRKSKKAPKAKISGLWKIIKIAHPQFKWMITGTIVLSYWRGLQFNDAKIFGKIN